MSKRALVVGINLYGHNSNLSGCVNDASDWQAVLESKGFAVSSLLDAEATGENIREELKALISGAVPGDSLVFQYSGHGTWIPDEDGDEPDGADEAICPVDIFDNGPITDDELYMIYGERPLGIKLFIFSDSCHSGTVSRFAGVLVDGAKSHGPQVKFLPPSTFLSLTQLRGVGRGFRRSLPPGRHAGLLLSGCADPEYSYDAWFNDRPNGAATYVALQALAKLAPNASYTTWYKRIRASLPSREYPQTPALFGSSVMKRWNVLS